MYNQNAKIQWRYKHLLPSEAAELLGVSKYILRKWGKEGKINEHRHIYNNSDDRCYDLEVNEI